MGSVIDSVVDIGKSIVSPVIDVVESGFDWLSDFSKTNLGKATIGAISGYITSGGNPYGALIGGLGAVMGGGRMGGGAFALQPTVFGRGGVPQEYTGVWGIPLSAFVLPALLREDVQRMLTGKAGYKEVKDVFEKAPVSQLWTQFSPEYKTMIQRIAEGITRPSVLGLGRYLAETESKTNKLKKSVGKPLSEAIDVLKELEKTKMATTLTEKARRQNMQAMSGIMSPIISDLTRLASEQAQAGFIAGNFPSVIWASLLGQALGSGSIPYSFKLGKYGMKTTGTDFLSQLGLDTSIFNKLFS